MDGGLGIIEHTCETCQSCFYKSDENILCAETCQQVPPDRTCIRWTENVVHRTIRENQEKRLLDVSELLQKVQRLEKYSKGRLCIECSCHVAWENEDRGESE